MKLLDKFRTYYNIETKGTLVLGDKRNRGKTHKSALEGREELESRKDKEDGQALWLFYFIKGRGYPVEGLMPFTLLGTCTLGS